MKTIILIIITLGLTVLASLAVKSGIRREFAAVKEARLTRGVAGRVSMRNSIGRNSLTIANTHATQAEASANKNQNREGEREKDDAEVILDRLRWFKESHPELDPELKLRVVRQGYDEREGQKQLKSTTVTSEVTENWVSLGPTNSAGRISSIAVHPSVAGTLYVGADSGGVWKTTDAGSTWSNLTDSISNLCVGAIAVAPSAPNILYVGTGSEHSSGIGLLRSIDGGNTWLFPANVIAGRFWRLSVHPTNPLELVAATDSGVLRSIDGGQTWTTTLSSVLAEDIKRDPDNPLVLFAAATTNGYSGGVIFKSTDGGISWSQKTAGLPGASDVMSIAIAPSNPQVIYVCTSIGGGATHIYKSVDGGNTWIDLPAIYSDRRFSVSHLLGNQAWHNNAIVVSPSNANLIIACGVFQIRSTDGGVTWTTPPLSRTPLPNCELNVHEDTTDLQFQGTTLYIAGDGGLFSTPDYGNTARAHNDGLVIRQYYSMFNDPVMLNRVLAGSQDNGTDRRSDGAGTSWVTVNVSDGFDSAVNTLQPSTAFATIAYGAIFRTRRAGTVNSCYFEDQHLEPQLPPGESGPFFTRLVIDTNNPATLYTLSNLRIWRTTDSGDSWLPVPTTTTDGSVWTAPSKMVVARSNSNVLMTSSGNDLFRSTDRGSTWVKKTLGNIVLNLEIDPRDSNLVYATAGGDVFVSSDGGNSWVARSNGLSQFPILVVRADPVDPNTLYCGSYDGVYASTNRGLSWNRFGSGLPSIFVEDLKVTSDGSTLRAATYGRGVWEIELRPGFAANIVGQVRDNAGNGIQNVNLSLIMGGVATEVAQTDSSGNYSFTKLALGRNYTVFPAKPNLNFSPQSLNFSNIGGDQIANFNSTVTTYNIAGRVADASGAAINGVAITISGSEARSSQTNGNGEYAVASLAPGGSYTVTPQKENYTFTPASRTFNSLAGNLSGNFVATPKSFQFNQAGYSVLESDRAVTVTIVRGGDTSTAATVDYSTADATARQNKDYCIASGTLTFAPGQTSASFVVLIVDNIYVDGNRTVNIALSNPTAGILGIPGLVSLTIVDNDTSPAAGNPLDDQDALFFVRQHYSDFLNRVPDPGGLAYWAGQITGCGTDQSCVARRRLDVSNAFFYELEFQQTGAYVYRLYRAAFGNDQPFSNPDVGNVAEAKKIPGYSVFVRDRARLAAGTNQAQQQWDLATVFVKRPEFLSRYSSALTGPAFIDSLLARIRSDSGVDLTSQRGTLINLFDQGGRGAVLYRLADDNLQTNPVNNRAFIDAEYNRSFVYTQYAGYLRRDSDIGGFLFWLGKVNEFPVRNAEIQHVMVCAFITSREYQERFSPVVTRTNSECGQ